MIRLTIIAVLGLAFALATSEGKSAAGCTITTELESGTELETIHNNVLCLIERLSAMEVATKSVENKQSGYVVLQRPTGGGGINPCPGNDCMEHFVQTLIDRCDNDDCVGGVEPWYPYMPQDWKHFIDNRRGHYEINYDQLHDALGQESLINSGIVVQVLDMKRLLESVPPSTLFNSVGIAGQ